MAAALDGGGVRRGRPGTVPDAGEPGPGDGTLRRAGLAVRERLPLWVQLRCGLEPRALAALTAVLVVAAVLAALHFWTGRPRTVKPPETLRQGAAQREAPSPGTAVPGAATPPRGRVVVDVSGKVRRPGVLRLPEGARVADALAAAGGAKAGTDLSGLNRARVLTDGEHVVVGAAVGTPGAGAAPLPPEEPGGPVGLNTATVEELDTLPGVGPVLARHIVDYRTRSGGFRSVDQLREVDGIGERRFAELRTLVRP
ncbi:ComEA family DNA-binding protein [Streptomyces qinzhouensis]|uniref:ComEA family DNA-binding protein n=1 Tax=Streptomyces qinzhouensis TaxID=2599401 RepID=A0A5B8J8B5_9ACTN|nr:ComEA family DNA-binding protein [Streptomyces qinzhouensis]